MNYWMVAYLVLGILGLGVELAKHGQPKTGNHNFFTISFGWSLTVLCLYMAGAFNLPN